MMDPALNTYRVSDAPAAVAALDASDAFRGLSEAEALYALGLSQAAWGAGKITVLQTSPESPPIFLLLRLVLDGGVEALRVAALAAGASDLDWLRFIKYAAMFIDNSGNYREGGGSVHESSCLWRGSCCRSCNASLPPPPPLSPRVVSFGDTKFVPSLDADAFERIVFASPACAVSASAVRVARWVLRDASSS